MFLSPVSLSPNSVRPPVLRNYESQTTLLTDGRSEDNSLDEVVSVMTTPKTGNRLHVPCEVRVLGAQVESWRWFRCLYETKFIYNYFNYVRDR